MADPFFTIIVPTYNYENYLPDALESLLVQTFRDWEAVVVNDGSTDRSGEVAESYALKDRRIRVVHKENGGVSTALNRGIEHARGDWICWLSSDDFFTPEKLQVHRDAIVTHPGEKFFFTSFLHLEEETGEVTSPKYNPPVPYRRVINMLHENYINGISIAIHRLVFEEVGLFDEKLRSAQDADMWLRASWKYLPHYIDKRTCITRLHEGQDTRSFFEACAFDSAFSIARFLNKHRYQDLFPSLNLAKTHHALLAARRTLKIALEPNAHIHSCGYNNSLMERFFDWLHHDCPVHAKYLILMHFKGSKWKKLLQKAPDEIRTVYLRLQNRDDVDALTIPYDFFLEAQRHVGRLSLMDKEEESNALKKYLKRFDSEIQTGFDFSQGENGLN